MRSPSILDPSCLSHGSLCLSLVSEKVMIIYWHNDLINNSPQLDRKIWKSSDYSCYSLVSAFTGGMNQGTESSNIKCLKILPLPKTMQMPYMWISMKSVFPYSVYFSQVQKCLCRGSLFSNYISICNSDDSLLTPVFSFLCFTGRTQPNLILKYINLHRVLFSFLIMYALSTSDFRL